MARAGLSEVKQEVGVLKAWGGGIVRGQAGGGYVEGLGEGCRRARHLGRRGKERGVRLKWRKEERERKKWLQLIIVFCVSCLDIMNSSLHVTSGTIAWCGSVCLPPCRRLALHCQRNKQSFWLLLLGLPDLVESLGSRADIIHLDALEQTTSFPSSFLSSAN